MDIEHAIFGRRTIRRFKQQQVEPEKIIKLIDAARMASSGGNQQPLRYVVVRNQNVVAPLFETTKWAAMVQPKRNPIPGESAPLTFLAVIVKAGTNPAVDAGAAIQNIQLMAYALDLGCCWIGAYDHAAADKILGLGENSQSIYLVAVGYPDEQPVSDDITTEGSRKYYLDEDDVLHVPKYTVESITEWK